jgi:hypothetical protein
MLSVDCGSIFYVGAGNPETHTFLFFLPPDFGLFAFLLYSYMLLGPRACYKCVGYENVESK